MKNEITSVTILRHGETEWNTAGKFQGQQDSHLTGLGIAQAKAAAAYLKNETFDLLCTSDLQRAWSTAKLINAELNLKMIAEPRLRERNLGIIQGLTRDELQQRYPEVAEQFNEANPDYLIPGSESARQCSERVAAWMAEIGQRHSGQALLVVTHGLIINYMLRHVLGIPLEVGRNFSMYNVSINRFHIQQGRWRLETWGETPHIKQLQIRDEILGVNL